MTVAALAQEPQTSGMAGEMMRREGSRRSSSTERLVGYLYGINDVGAVVEILIRRDDRNVSLSGPGGSHPMHPANAGSIEGWKREAAAIWHLSEVINIPGMAANSASSRQQLSELEMKAAKLRKALR
jgi:hypothetical protein